MMNDMSLKAKIRNISKEKNMGDRKGLPGYHASGADLRGAWRFHSGASVGRTDKECERIREYDAGEILCVPRLRQCHPEHRRGAHPLPRSAADAAGRGAGGRQARGQRREGRGRILCDRSSRDDEGTLYLVHRRRFSPPDSACEALSGGECRDKVQDQYGQEAVLLLQPGRTVRRKAVTLPAA